MKRNLVVGVVLCACCSFTPILCASINLNTGAVQNSVVFIYPTIPASRLVDSDNKRALGTGFLVRIPSMADPTRGSVVLITARHIVEPSWAYCSGPDPELIFIRVNKPTYDPQKGGSGVEYLALALRKSGAINYLVSGDERVDAAVVVLEPSEYPEFLANMTLPVSDFASKDELKSLRVGDPIASAGLVPGQSGENRNYPFFKFGNISNIPGEGAFTGCGSARPALRQERVWFIAANLVAGNSGSPIFYLPPGGNGVSFGGRSALIGIQSSSLPEADIACMTPIEDVFQILKDHFGPLGADLYRGVSKGH